MTENLVFILPIITFVIGGALSYFFVKLKSEKESSVLTERYHGLAREKAEKELTISELEANVTSIRDEKENLNIELTKMEASSVNLQTKLE